MTAHRPLRAVIFMGSTRAKRVGDRVTAQLVGAMRERAWHTETIDPRASHDGFFMRLLEKPLFHYNLYKPGEDVPAALTATAASITSADAVVVCSPEMNHTLAPGLVNVMSHFGSTLFAHKPAGIATYSAGNWGGARAGVALRPFLSELGCLPVSATWQLARAWKAFGDDGALRDADGADGKTLQRMLDQLEWHASAMRAHRDAFGESGPSYYEQVAAKSTSSPAGGD